MEKQIHYFAKKIDNTTGLFYQGYTEDEFQAIRRNLKGGELPSGWLCYHCAEYSKKQWEELRKNPFLVQVHPVFGKEYANAVKELIYEKKLPTKFSLRDAVLAAGTEG